MSENIWSGGLFLKWFFVVMPRMSAEVHRCGGDQVHFFSSLHAGVESLVSEFVFVATGHWNMFTTSIHEAVEFHPPAAHL